jgi:aminopeptidase N
MAHELAHSWVGNMITCASWHDIWLNEGFATYFTGLTYEFMFDGQYWNLWKQYNIKNIISKPYGSVYVKDTTDINRIFDARLSYSKGAMVLHMLRWIIGDSAFLELFGII